MIFTCDTMWLDVFSIFRINVVPLLLTPTMNIHSAGDMVVLATRGNIAFRYNY